MKLSAGSLLGLRPKVHHLTISILLRRNIGTNQTISRTYATRRELPTTSLLDQQRGTSARQSDSVGPFQLGLIPPTPRDGGNTKKWSELTTGGKVVRTTARLSNLVVILFGAGFSAMLVYALTSELFSKNSATVLYGQACDLIRSSPKVAQYLQGPLIFHNNPPSPIRPRHRNDRVASQLGRDASGRETMFLNFFVEAKKPGSSTRVKEDQSWWESTVYRTSESMEALTRMSADEVWQSTKDYASGKWESAKNLFRFLSGDPVPTSQPEITAVSVEPKVEQKERGWKAGFTGLFAGLRGSHGREVTETDGDLLQSQRFTEGEVHAHLVMNDHGQFEFRTLRVDIPDSHSPNPKRVYVIMQHPRLR